MNMNHYERITLLSDLANAIDAGTATVLETQAFDCIMEILNEQIENRNISNSTAKYFKSTGRGRRIRLGEHS